MFLLLTLLHVLVQETGGSNILFFYFPVYSHFRGSFHVANELATRGHMVWNAVPTRMANDKRLQAPGIKHVEYKSLGDIDIEGEADKVLAQYLETGTFNIGFDIINEICHRILTDEDLVQSISSLNIDLVILDSVLVARLLTILPYKLGLPFMFMGASFEPYASRSPFVMSTFPFPIMPWSPRMDFRTRLLNTLMMSCYWVYDPLAGYWSVAQYAPAKPYISVEALTARGLLWVVELEPLLHYPQALLPNVKFVGSLTNSVPKKLPEKYQRFCDEAKHGVVVVSFGSNVKKLPTYLFDRLIKAFSQTEYRYIFKSDKNADVGDNIMLTDWMPQTDLLAHSNTKLFITHCGANGQNEAFLSGVPMIGFPLFAEQHFNARKLQYNGFGTFLDIRSFTVEELVTSIHEVIQNESYSKNIKRIAEITKLREISPKEEAVYWIEHVLQYGGDHLRSYCQDMPLYQYLNLDVIAFLLVLVHLFVYIIWRLCCCCIKCTTRGKVKKD